MNEQVPAPDQDDCPVMSNEDSSQIARAQMKRVSRKSFIWAGVAVLSAYSGLRILDSRREEDGTIWPFRASFLLNEQIQRDLYGVRMAPTFDPARATEPALNYTDEEGNIDEVDIDEWRLSVEGLHGHDDPVLITMAELKNLPEVTQTTEFNCIEGWTAIVSWKGVRFLDFAERYGPQTRNGKPPEVRKKPDQVLEYVAMETVDGLYYVGLDTLSALHPQTLLAYEMNGKELNMEHGFPLRLVIPTKYGIKNIKRVGKIRFTSERPKDYWAENGYDWYSGL